MSYGELSLAMNRSAPVPPLVGFLCFQIGFGATAGAIVWTWLADSSETLRGISLLLPVLFGIALPLAISWLPFTVASAFVTRPDVRGFIGLFPAMANMVLIAAQEFPWLDDEYAFLISIGAFAVLQVAQVMLATSSARLNQIPSPLRSYLNLGGWLVGLIVTAAGGLVFGLPLGLMIGTLLLAVAGLLLGQSGSITANPWIPAERSIGRFARLLDLLRFEKKTRDSLLLVSSLFGLLTTALALLVSNFSDNAAASISLAVPSLTLASFLAGFGLGATPWIAFGARWWRPAIAIPFCLLLGAVGLVMLTFHPSPLAWLSLPAGIALGMPTRLAREEAFRSLDRKGARLPLETEALVGTFMGLALISSTLLIWISQLTFSATSLVSPGVLVFLLLWLALLYYRFYSEPSHPDEADENPAPEEKPPPIILASTVTYLPGSGFDEGSPVPADGRAVTIVYEVPEEDVAEFREAVARVARTRRRQGALHWRLSQDLEDSRRFTESYLLESWSDYQEVLRHESPEDRAAKQRIFDLNDWDSLPYESHEAIAEV